jgi:5-methyltetrahydrofolate--homocysteine methyltransferase
MSDYAQLHEAILNGDNKAAAAITRQALGAGVDPMDLVATYMIPSMDEVGRRFAEQEYFVPELLLSGRAMKAALELIRPLLAAKGVEPAGRVVIGTVKGDLHDIGKNLVAAMLEGGGFEVTDLGVDVPPERFIQAAQEKRADLVCLSALLTVTMPAMRATVEAFEKAGIREQVRIMVGGAPVTSQFASKIGADGFSENASGAVEVARRFLGAVHA